MNREEQNQLWKRIEAFEFDAGDVDLSFAQRLARENAWSKDFAERVLFEYKRFVYLGFSAGHPVTPSDQVDQAWHLHLTYTQSYWDKFCGETLGKPFHHNPTKGGEGESDKFNDWYQKTLESYERIFNEEPPEDIWPSVEIRFGHDLNFKRVNTKDVWVVRKPKSFIGKRNLCIALTVFLVLSSIYLNLDILDDNKSHLKLPSVADPGIVTIIAVVLGGVLYISLRILFDSKCAKCKKFRAFRKTGKSRYVKEIKRFAKEYKCRFCGVTKWVNDPPQSSGGSGGLGCGGGGCGGGGCGGG